MLDGIDIRSAGLDGVEVAWFIALWGDECERFARYVLPRLPTCRLAYEQGRLANLPGAPQTTGVASN